MSLCAGIAGIDLGLGLAIEGARTICFVENEGTAVEKLVARFEDGTLDRAPIWTNLKTFRGKPWRGRVGILTAGYPCQPFSCAGKQRGAKDPRHLWPHVARIISEAQPEVVFLENVENHLRIGYEQVRGELQRLGYTVTEGIFSAEEVGAPHLRKRLFILAYREERGRGILRESSRRSGLTDRRGAQLEDAARRGPRERTGTRPAGADVAHTEHNNRRSQLQSQEPAPNRRRGPAGSGPLFPPGPADFAAWSPLLKRDCSLEPSVRRMPNGSSSRVDRLRACGNAVLPLVAGFAFRSLARTALARHAVKAAA